jgi:hypothetical protein
MNMHECLHGPISYAIISRQLDRIGPSAIQLAGLRDYRMDLHNLQLEGWLPGRNARIGL